ncbi:hypothetical protein AM501_09085 [Aneurinibacillus migulanus]|uniref:DUF2164 domain-containing protein n=1 Tax=Aneurinibacillus migulanus TaxID=47500 RepID=UPI0005B8A896|nr:DUF2164 domain-containing protein [Aneurinibacillus migulanus]KIV56853.1 hypothetical protein TS64_08795 [Aneurinibacillus migulanus]KPD08553.1 hypothetical protein AM501_09085 [Aneurinibacillus migulanus]MED4730659.1 DUF2164 domain-containing protein [Aneurinibacillus migulanus]
MFIKKVPKEHKDTIITNIQLYFSKERDDSLGNLEAEQLFDFMLNEIAPIIYNQALSDVRKVIQQQFDSLEEEIYALEKPLR